MRLDTHSLGMESINYQYGKTWFEGLVIEIDALLNTADSKAEKAFIESNRLQDYIRKATGINIAKLVLEDKPYVNAMVQVPIIKKNNPVIGRAREAAFAAYETPKSITDVLTNSLDRIGYVDLVAGKVGGIYAELPVDVYLTKALLRWTNPAEIAAVLCHELGHVFSYFLCMHKTMTCSLVLESVSKNLLGTNPVDTNYKILKRVEHQLDIQLPNIKKIALEKNSAKLQAVVIDSTITALQESTKDGWLYDSTAWEQASDQYVSRLGAGVHLARGLNKLTQAGMDFSKSSEYRIIAAISNIVGFLWAHSFILLGLMLRLMGVNLELNLYDNHNYRIERIKRDTIGRLMNRKLTKAQLNDVIEMIDAIELEKLDQDAPTRTLPQMILTYVAGDSKTRNKERLLEELGSNDLLVTAARFRALS